MDLTYVLILDCTTLLGGIFVLRKLRLTFYHPLAIYLLFHFVVFTMRAVNLANGAVPLFALEGIYAPVVRNEIVRGVQAADLGAAAFMIGVLWSRRRHITSRKREVPSMPLSREVLRRTTLFVLPVGIIGMLSFLAIPGVSSSQGNLQSWSTSSSWFLITSTWPGLLLLAYIYIDGFKKHLLLLQTLYLLLMAYQGFHRFRVVLPLVVLLNIYLTRTNRAWPQRKLVLPLLLAIALFFPLKSVGVSLQRGDTLQQMADSLKKSYSELIRGENDDQKILDQLASAITLVDGHGRFYWGKTYLPLLTLPVPRAWWPDKPDLVQYLSDISRPWRPMREWGMVTTIFGESYANGGYGGIVLILFATGLFLSKSYEYAMARPYVSVERFTYILVTASLLLVYRDGLISLVVFTLVQMMPLFVMIAFHLVIRRQVRRAQTRMKALSRA